MPSFSKIQNPTRAKFHTFAGILNRECKIQKLVQVAEDISSDPFKFGAAPIKNTYEDLLVAWCGVIPAGGADFIKAIRGDNVEDVVTHNIWIRESVIKFLGASFTNGFSNGFKVTEDVAPLKSDYFVVLMNGENKGKRLKIVDTGIDEINKEFVIMNCTMLSEVGTGYGN